MTDFEALAAEVQALREWSHSVQRRLEEIDGHRTQNPTFRSSYMQSIDHTEGPWLLAPGGYMVISDEPDCEFICATANNKTMRTLRAAANAKFITRAPEMEIEIARLKDVNRALLEACKRAQSESEDWGAFVHAAIRKAEST